MKSCILVVLALGLTACATNPVLETPGPVTEVVTEEVVATTSDGSTTRQETTNSVVLSPAMAEFRLKEKKIETERQVCCYDAGGAYYAPGTYNNTTGTRRATYRPPPPRRTPKVIPRTSYRPPPPRRNK